MGRALVRVVAGLGVLVTVTFVGVIALLFAGATGGSGGGSPQTSLCLSQVTGIGQVSDLDADQLTNAKTIINVGRGLRVPDRGVVIALATAMQESTLRNLTYGDRDSVGLFQQRPSSGWGSVTELTTPDVAARKFYASLLQVSGWQDLPLTEAAQRVQRSAFPLAYAKWEALATSILQAAGAGTATLDCGSSIGIATPGGAIGEMLRIALGQQGKPYVWGATGPDAFDCSGLVVYAWRMAGYRVTVRTSEQMYVASDRVQPGAEQPGDLLFSHFEAAGPGHVMIVVRPGMAVEAPQTGDVVKVIPYRASDWVIGRLHTDALEQLPAA